MTRGTARVTKQSRKVSTRYSVLSKTISARTENVLPQLEVEKAFVR